MSPVIRVEGLSKRYTIGARKEGAAQYDTFREALIRKLKSPFRGLSLSGPQPSTPTLNEFPLTFGRSRMSRLKFSKVRSWASSGAMAQASRLC